MSRKVRPRSLRRDLALGLALGLTGLWLVGILGAGLTLRHEIGEVFDSALQETAERILPLAVIELLAADPERPAQRISPVGPHQEYLTYAVRDRDGAILMYSHDADLATFADAPREGFRTTATHRLFGRSAVSGEYLIEVAEPLDHRRESVWNAVQALLAPVLILLPLSLLGVAWFTRRSLRPVEALSQEVRARSAADLGALATKGLPVELVPIREAVNRLMARLARAISAERSFTANAAHELRTPVAASLAQAQRLIAEAPEGPLRDRARTVEAELKRLGRLSEKLLHLSRAEGGSVLADAPHDLGPVLALVVQDFQRAGSGARLVVSAPDTPVLSRMDADAFAILLRNLIENALSHGTAGAAVEVTLHRNGLLAVVNACAVVPPDALARLTTRFERAGARNEGSGLGLAIVASIAKGAGTVLELQSPAPGRADGFAALVRLG